MPRATLVCQVDHLPSAMALIARLEELIYS